MTIVLWIVQGLLALAFLLAGVMKTFMPLEGLKKNMTWVGNVPAGLVRFIGIVEILGALGLERSELPVEAYCNGPVHVYVTLSSTDRWRRSGPTSAR